MVWCGVLKALLPEGKGRDVHPRVQVNGKAVCVVCAMCDCVLLHSRTSAHSHLASIALPTLVPNHKGSRRPTAPCVPRCTMSVFCVVAHCLLLCTTVHCNACALLHYSRGHRAVGSGSPATHLHTAFRLWSVELLQRTASLPRAVGSGIPAVHCLTALGQWVVLLLQCWA